MLALPIISKNEYFKLARILFKTDLSLLFILYGFADS
jgi:hypothetical protein